MAGDNIIPFPTDTLANFSCPDCGSEWFTVRAVVFDLNMMPIGYGMPVVCNECGCVIKGGA